MNALAERGHLIYASCLDAKFYVDPSDRTVGTVLVWETGEWAKRETAQAIAVLNAAGRLSPSSTFVDVGANIGTQTVYAMQSGAFAGGIAFEPEPSNAALLRMNVAVNGFAQRVNVIERAVGDFVGQVDLYLHPRSKGNHMVGKAPVLDGTQVVKVPITRLDVALEEAGLRLAEVGLVWIDVEGLEPEVVRGMGKYLSAGIPLVLEWSPLRYTPDDRAELIGHLAKHYSKMQSLRPSPTPPPPMAPQALQDLQTGYTDILLY